MTKITMVKFGIQRLSLKLHLPSTKAQILHTTRTSNKEVRHSICNFFWIFFLLTIRYSCLPWDGVVFSERDPVRWSTSPSLLLLAFVHASPKCDFESFVVVLQSPRILARLSQLSEGKVSRRPSCEGTAWCWVRRPSEGIPSCSLHPWWGSGAGRRQTSGPPCVLLRRYTPRKGCKKEMGH